MISSGKRGLKLRESCCQLCRHWLNRRLSQRQHLMLPVTIKLTSDVVVVTIIGFHHGWCMSANGLVLRDISSPGHCLGYYPGTMRLIEMYSMGCWHGIVCMKKYLMMSSNNNIFLWFPLIKASDAKLWCFLWSATEKLVEQSIETPVIWDAIALIMMLL